MKTKHNTITETLLILSSIKANNERLISENKIFMDGISVHLLKNPIE